MNAPVTTVQGLIAEISKARAMGHPARLARVNPRFSTYMQHQIVGVVACTFEPAPNAPRRSRGDWTLLGVDILADASVPYGVVEFES